MQAVVSSAASTAAAEASARTAAILQAHSSPPSQPPTALPASILQLQKPPQFHDPKVSGKFTDFLRNLLHFCHLHGYDPNNPFSHPTCRQIALCCLQGTALAYVQHLERHLPASDPFHSTFDGLISALRSRFTNPEESTKARLSLHSLTMSSAMTARDYATEFQRLLDDIDTPIPAAELIFLFRRGLPYSLQHWLQFSNPQTLHEAIQIACRMDKSNLNAVPAVDSRPTEPMVERVRTPAVPPSRPSLSNLSRPPLRFPAPTPLALPPRSRTAPPDPRADERWPSWAKCSTEHLRACWERNLYFLCCARGPPLAPLSSLLPQLPTSSLFSHFASTGAFLS